MIDRMGFPVADAERSRAFYDKALAPLGLSLQMEATPDQTESGGTALCYGKHGNPFPWVGDNECGDAGKGVADGFHVAFTVDTRAQVDAFHAAALEAGGRDNGAPGLREGYGLKYYAAFAFDPDGANIEAVCHAQA